MIQQLGYYHIDSQLYAVKMDSIPYALLECRKIVGYGTLYRATSLA